MVESNLNPRALMEQQLIALIVKQRLFYYIKS